MPEDITAGHKRVEKDPESLLVELQRRTAEQEAMLSSMVVGVAIYDRSGYMVSLNPAGSRMRGITESDLPKHYRDVLSALHMEDWEGRPISPEQTSVARALKGMTVKDYQFTVLLKNRERRWLLGSAAPIRSVDGDTTGVVLTIIDATERKQAEEIAAAERQRLFTVLETLPIMVCLLTPDYHVAFANRSFRERFVNPAADTVMNIASGAANPASSARHTECWRLARPTSGRLPVQMGAFSWHTTLRSPTWMVRR